jgi:uncharacterized membrane protein (UPF0182 family)
MQRRNWLWVLIGIVVAIGLGATAISTFYTNMLWFREVGFLSVFTKIISARVAIAVLGGLFFFLITLLSLVAVMWRRRDFTVVGGLVMPIPITIPRSYRRYLALPALVVGVLGGVAAYSQWHVVLAYLNQIPFGTADPFFAKDVGFYIFTLPFYRLLQQHLWVAFLSSLAVSAFVYFILGDIRFAPRRIAVERRARIHLSVLAAILFALKAWGYQISTWNLMYSPRGVAFGASYADIHAQAPAYRVLMFGALLGAGISLFSLALRSFRFIGYSVLGLVALSLAVGYAYPAFMQQFTVSPNELAYELPFIEHNINFTREAFDIDDIQSSPFAAENDITQADLNENAATIQNFRLWDYRVLKDTYTQMQEIRMYYSFHDVDVERYEVGGQTRLVLSSPRELDIRSLPAEATSWVNLHLKYTHGYGMVMSPASEVTRDGMPSFYLMDIPPKSTTEIKVERPELYFGELSNHYIVVNTKEPEFDYPRTDTETIAPTFYQGKAGIPVGSILNRLAFMLRFRDYQILVSGAITPESRLIMTRNIMERVQTIAPFFMYDPDPYLVTADGRMYWMIDAYTVTANYPYSQPDAILGVNYIRNSVKVVIDAYDGTVTFYQADEEDPIIRTYAKIFPDLLTPIEEMPDSLKAHVRYPEALFAAQSRMLLTYHMTDPSVYYNKEDYWELPREIYGNAEQAVSPYYVVIDVPGQPQPEYMLMTSFTPRGKQNMTAWLGIRCDYEDYGKATLYTVPKDQLVAGPMQVESLFSQNPMISEATTLWGQVGTQVIRGNLLVIPVGDSLLYVEPLYLQAERVKIPELKRVLMYYGGRVVMGTSPGEALSQLFGDIPAVPPGPGGEGGEPTDLAGLVAAANRLWSEAQEALKAGDWAGYGRAIDELGQVLSELSGLTGVSILETPPVEPGAP